MNELLIGPSDLLVFDAVDTLFYPNPPVVEAYYQLGEQCGAKQSREHLQTNFAPVYAAEFAGEISDPTDHEDIRGRWLRVVGRLFPDVANRDALFASLWSHFADAANWSLFADVEPTLLRLRQAGVPFAIASNFDDRIESVLQGFPCLSDAAQVVWSSQLGFAKPNRQFFDQAAERFQRSAEQLIMIGDSVSRDFEGPRKAGWRSILLDRSGGSQLPHVISLAELPAFIGF